MKQITLGIAVFLVGCAATPLNLGADRVKLTNVEPAKECKFLGDITGSQGDYLTGGYTSNANLETGARNDLKNKAAAMGGNVVQILTQRAGGNYMQQTNVTISGGVYKCPE
jgi:hypothetical protein